MNKMKEISADEAYARLSLQRERIESFMRQTEDTTPLIEKNPAFYVHLHSEPVSINEVAERAGLELKAGKEILREQCHIQLVSVMFLLRKYTGSTRFEFDEKLIENGSYFWEVHVDASMTKGLTPLEKVRVAQEDVAFFYQSAKEPQDKELEVPSKAIARRAIHMVGDCLLIGPVSPLSRLFRVSRTVRMYKDAGSLPEALLNVNRDLIQLTVENGGGSMNVDTDTFYSVIITAQDLRRLLPQPNERE